MGGGGGLCLSQDSRPALSKIVNFQYSSPSPESCRAFRSRSVLATRFILLCNSSVQQIHATVGKDKPEEEVEETRGRVALVRV